jgi:hypothetical protein
MAMQCHASDDHARHQHYGNGRRHDTSVCDTPHALHEKVNSSGKPLKRGVLRTSFMR